MERKAEIRRKTNETDIALSLVLEGGERKIGTDSGFFNHMLDLFAVHGGFGMQVNCKGDSDVDFHHTVEDVGIALGQAFAAALGDKKGIARYAHILLPMDETLILCAADISGRGYLNFDVEMPAAKVFDGDETPRPKAVGLFDSELAEEFFSAFAREAKITLHFKKLYGKSTHHIIEGVFKAFGRVMKDAVRIVGGGVPSSKGSL